MVAGIRALESRIVGQPRESAGSAIATSDGLAQHVQGTKKFWGLGCAFSNSMDHAEAGMILPPLKRGTSVYTSVCTLCIQNNFNIR
jgi:hypothetical protein